MKRIAALALVLATAASGFAQKQNVDAASKLIGKVDKLNEARELISKAEQDPTTASDVRTYYVGGKNEFEAFKSGLLKLAINPNDPSVNQLDMCDELLRGYKQYMKALPLDSMPNEKGQIKPKYSKEIINTLNERFEDFYNAGGTFYNAKKYYPEAYDAFMTHAAIWSSPYASNKVKALADTIVDLSYFNAGISAYAAEELEASARAFKQARLNGTPNPQNYIYEIACWQYLANRDSTMSEAAKENILEIAKAGYDKFGMDQPLFFNNMVNSMVMNEDMTGAIALIDDQISKTPDKPSLYGLRGFVNDRAGKDDESVKDYKKAAEFADCDYENLKNVAKKVFRVGTTKWNELEGPAQEERKTIKADYFDYANNLLNRIKQDPKSKGDGDLDYLVENVEYVLETYFPKK